MIYFIGHRKFQSSDIFYALRKEVVDLELSYSNGRDSDKLALNEISEASMVVVNAYYPDDAGRTYIELGIALAYNKPIYMLKGAVAAGRIAFYESELITHFDTVEDLVDAVVKIYPSFIPEISPE